MHKISFKQRELPSILKGFRYLNGYTQKDLAKKLDVSKSSVNRWETNFSKLKRRKNRLIKLLEKTPYSIEELMYYGNIDIKRLIEEIKKKYNLSYRKCAEIFGFCDATLKWIKDETIRLNPSTIKKIIDRYKELESIKDKREILYNLYVKRFISNKKGLYIRYMRQNLGLTQKGLANKAKISADQLWKFEVGYYKTDKTPYKKLRDALKSLSGNFCALEKEVLEQIKNQNNFELLQIKRAKKYPFIIGFKLAENEGSQLEEYVFDLFQNMGFEVFRNPILADKYLRIQHCIDLFAIKGKTKICIECKNCSKTQTRNKFKLYGNRLLELNEMFLNLILISNRLISKRKKSIEKRRGITVLDNHDLDRITKNPHLLFSFLKKENLELPSKIDSIEDIKSLKRYCNLSYIQIAMLIELSPIYTYQVINKKRKLTIKFKNRLERILRLARRGRIRKLHFEANFRLALSKYNRNKVISLDTWKSGKNYNKIINFISNNHKGALLESNVAEILHNLKWTIFQNVILANKNVSEKHEIDIYAIKDDKEVIIETKNKLRGWNINSAYISRESEHKANLFGINKRLIITQAKIKSLAPFLRKNIEVLRYDKNLKENLQRILN